MSWSLSESLLAISCSQRLYQRVLQLPWYLPKSKHYVLKLKNRLMDGPFTTLAGINMVVLELYNQFLIKNRRMILY